MTDYSVTERVERSAKEFQEYADKTPLEVSYYALGKWARMSQLPEEALALVEHCRKLERLLKACNEMRCQNGRYIDYLERCYQEGITPEAFVDWAAMEGK